MSTDHMFKGFAFNKQNKAGKNYSLLGRISKKLGPVKKQFPSLRFYNLNFRF